jgi:hypothetical protein
MKPVRDERQRHLQRVLRERERQQQRRAAKLDWSEIIIQLHMLRERHAPQVGLRRKPRHNGGLTKQRLTSALVGQIDHALRQLGELRSEQEQTQALQRVTAIRLQRGQPQQQPEDVFNWDDAQVKLDTMATDYKGSLLRYGWLAQGACDGLAIIRETLEQLEPIDARLTARRAVRELRKVVAQYGTDKLGSGDAA